MDDQQRAREQFETWASKYWNPRKARWAGVDRYRSDDCEKAWQAWQAATAALRAAPEAVALRTAMRTLEQIASTPRNKGARVNAKATLLFLQTQLAARPQGVSSDFPG